MENSIILKMSDVVFHEDSHTYLNVDSERVSGITSLIHSILQLGVYPDATPRVEQIYIPRAGYYGSCVHHAIQIYETLGIDMTEYPPKDHATRDFGVVTFPGHDVMPELNSYREFMKKKRLHCIASEYTVDYGSYASQIDNVSEDEEGNIWLVDFKTNNLDAYPGGVEGLQEYLSWQLSCYAFMFEHLNPDKRVKGLIGLWLKGEDYEAWDIKRQPDDQVECLLNTIALLGDEGWIYLNADMQVENAVIIKEPATDLAVPNEVTSAIADLIRAEKIAKQMKEKLRELMEEKGITKWECDQFTASISKPSETKNFDVKSFEQEHPRLYKKYTTTTTRKGSFKITAK